MGNRLAYLMTEEGRLDRQRKGAIVIVAGPGIRMGNRLGVHYHSGEEKAHGYHFQELWG